LINFINISSNLLIKNYNNFFIDYSKKKFFFLSLKIPFKKKDFLKNLKNIKKFKFYEVFSRISFYKLFLICLLNKSNFNLIFKYFLNFFKDFFFFNLNF